MTRTRLRTGGYVAATACVSACLLSSHHRYSPAIGTEKTATGRHEEYPAVACEAPRPGVLENHHVEGMHPRAYVGGSGYETGCTGRRSPGDRLGLRPTRGRGESGAARGTAAGDSRGGYSPAPHSLR